MSNEKYLLVYGSGTAGLGVDVIDHTSITGFDVVPPWIDIALKPEMLTFPDIDFKIPRERPRRDWEQRQKTRRRK